MQTRDSKTPKKILVTGAAGFIGFHLSLFLKSRGDLVIGVDNFNSYYDPQLKRDRSEILKKQGIEILHADILERDLIRLLLLRHGISHVVHLAAQAGVRHSLSAPDEYISSNIDGFASLLEACRHFPKLKIVYASSSSVYGLNQKVPFSETDSTDKPSNLYGATKKANELMAHAYHHLYGLSLTALRYFTVYGPWGRPDMAYYRFTKLILEKQPIEVFNSGKMRRDFTYIDDIVKGTAAAIDLGAPFEIFNLGGNSPVEVSQLIALLEKALKQKACAQMLPMQPGEVIQTSADIQKSQKMLNFSPSVSLEEGIAKFTEWYKTYHNTSQFKAVNSF